MAVMASGDAGEKPSDMTTAGWPTVLVTGESPDEGAEVPEGSRARVDDSDRVGELDGVRELEPVTVDVAVAEADADDVRERDCVELALAVDDALAVTAALAVDVSVAAALAVGAPDAPLLADAAAVADAVVVPDMDAVAEPVGVPDALAAAEALMGGGMLGRAVEDGVDDADGHPVALGERVARMLRVLLACPDDDDVALALCVEHAETLEEAGGDPDSAPLLLAVGEVLSTVVTVKVASADGDPVDDALPLGEEPEDGDRTPDPEGGGEWVSNRPVAEGDADALGHEETEAHTDDEGDGSGDPDTDGLLDPDTDALGEAPPDPELRALSDPLSDGNKLGLAALVEVVEPEAAGLRDTPSVPVCESVIEGDGEADRDGVALDHRDADCAGDAVAQREGDAVETEDAVPAPTVALRDTLAQGLAV